MDLVKAYNTVNRKFLWKLLARCGVLEKMITILKKLCNNTTISLTTENIESIFKSMCGVKHQGDNLAPILSVIFLNAATTTLKKKQKFEKPDFQWFPNTKK